MRKLDRSFVLIVLLSMTLLAGRALAQNGGNGGSGGNGGGGGTGGGSSSCTCAPGEANCMSEVNVGSVNSGHQGERELTINAPPTNEVVIDGCVVSSVTGTTTNSRGAADDPNNFALNVRWRVVGNNNPAKLAMADAPSISQTPATGKPTSTTDPSLPTKFTAVMVNYDQNNDAVNYRLSLNPCVISLDVSAVTVESKGKNSQIGVTASPSVCSWLVSSNATWLHFSASSGTGPSVLAFTVDPNAANTQRVGTATIGGQTFTVTQLPAGGCVASISPASVTVGNVSSSGGIQVTIYPGCPWSVIPNDPWITVSGGGVGSGTATYTVADNTDASPRTGTAVIAGQPFTVTQQGFGCTFIINPPSISITHFAFTDTVTLTSAFTCPWSASSNVPWITVNPTSGTGPYPVQYSVEANTDPVQRTGTLMIAGQPFTVSQMPGICALISPTGTGFVAQGNLPGSVTVTAPTSCSWTAVANVPWITIQSGSSGTGFGAVVFSVDDNFTGLDRSGYILIGGNGFYVSQSSTN